MGRGVGGSNLGQTQVELSGLNRVFHELVCLFVCLFVVYSEPMMLKWRYI